MIFGMAFLLRVIGIHFGLPHLYHADEPIVVNHALAYGTGDPNPHFFKIPPLVSYLLFLCYALSYLTGRALGWFKGVGDFGLLFLKDPTFFYLLARLVFGAFLGTACVFLLYHLIRRHFSRETALLSAFFLAVAFLPVRDSHYVYTDTPLILVLVASFFPILNLTAARSGWKDHLGAGVWIGLATATKYNGAMIIIPYLVGSLLDSNKEKIPLKCLSSLLIALLTYTLANPFTWLDLDFFRREIFMQARAEQASPPFHHLIYSLNGGIGPFLLGLGILGMISGLLKKEKKRLILSSFLMSYYLLLVGRSQPYDRYVLPLLPFLLFFAADFIFQKAERIPTLLRGKVLLLIALIAALPSLTKTIVSDLLFLRKDIRTQAKEWIESSIQSGANLALDWTFYMPRLSFSTDQLREKLRIAGNDPHFSEAQLRRLEFLLAQDTSLQRGFHLYFLSKEAEEPHFLFAKPILAFDVDELKKKKIDYVLIARVQKEYPYAEFYDELKKKAELVKRFNPYRDPARKYPLDTQPLTGGPFLWKELAARERNGQPIEIYKLK